MISYLVVRVAELILLAALLLGAVAATCVLAPIGSFGIGGGFGVSQTEVISFKMQVGKTQILRVPILNESEKRDG